MTVLHFGVTREREDSHPDETLVGLSALLADVGFTYHRDSFREWGESLHDGEHDGDPAHLVWTTDDEVTMQVITQLWARLENLLANTNTRSLDYVIVTDDAWSEDPRVVLLTEPRILCARHAHHDTSETQADLDRHHIANGVHPDDL